MAHHLILPDLAPTPPPLDFFRSQPGDLLPDGVNDTTKTITHEGTVGILTTSNPVLGTLTVGAPLVLLEGALPNQPINATIAQSLIENFSTIRSTQTTPGIGISFPVPLDTRGGRIMNFCNEGSASITISGTVPTTVSPFSGASFVWTGSNWIPLYIPPLQFDFWRSEPGTLLPNGITDTTDAIHHEGAVGIKTGVTIVPGALDVNAPFVRRRLFKVNVLPASGPIGTAATTVDIASALVIQQGVSSGLVYTIPTPTDLTSGRRFTITNQGGNNPFQIQTDSGLTTISNGQQVEFVYDALDSGGAGPGAWYAPPAAPNPSDFFRTPNAAGALPDGTNDVTEQIVRTGDIGVGLTGATVPVAKLDLNGSLVTRAASGTITFLPLAGNFMSTAQVDATAYVPLTGSAGATLTIPNPTNLATHGRWLTIMNSGATTYTVQGITIPPATFRSYIFDTVSATWLPEAPSSADFFRSGSVTGALPDNVTDMADTIYHTGDVGLGHTGAQTAPVGSVTIRNKGLVLSPGTVTNFPVNGSITAAIINVSSTILVAQTTAGITITLSAPTDATSQGRVLMVLNSGTAAFTILGVLIKPGQFGDFVWQGAGTWSVQTGQANAVGKFRQVVALPNGVPVVIAHSLALTTPFAAMVEVRDDASGQTITNYTVTVETANSLTITATPAVASGRVTVIG